MVVDHGVAEAIELTESCLLGALIDELLLGIRRGGLRFWLPRLAARGFLEIYRGLGKSSIMVFVWRPWRCLGSDKGKDRKEA